MPEDYTKYIFLKDPKSVPSNVSITLKAEHLEEIHQKIDVAETLSCVKAKMIKKLEQNKVIFEDGKEINFNQIDFNDIKSLIWW